MNDCNVAPLPTPRWAVDEVFTAIISDDAHPLSRMLYGRDDSLILIRALVNAAATFHQLDPKEGKPFRQWFAWFASQAGPERQVTVDQMHWWLAEAVRTGNLKDDEHSEDVHLFLDRIAEVREALG